jgi:NADH-quinone oxidoreductase subunit C
MKPLNDTSVERGPESPPNPGALCAALAEACPEHPWEAETLLIDEVVLSLPAGCLRPAVLVLRDSFGIFHLSTITGQEVSAGLELLYHFWGGRGITLRVALHREAPRLPTLTDLIPGADFYEREIAEMLGVTFEGHPGPAHLLLSDDWEGGHPLREDAS